MDAPALLIERTRTAAEVYFGSCNTPCINTLEDCQDACKKMHLNPDELIAPHSRLWQTIQLCERMSAGSAVFTFRGDSSESLIHDSVEDK